MKNPLKGIGPVNHEAIRRIERARSSGSQQPVANGPVGFVIRGRGGAAPGQPGQVVVEFDRSVMFFALGTEKAVKVGRQLIKAARAVERAARRTPQ